MSGRSPDPAYLGTRRDDGQSPADKFAGDFADLMSSSGEPAHFGRRTARTTGVDVLPQNRRSAPSDSSPDTVMPAGRSSRSRSLPVFGSTRRRSLSSPSQVPCHSSPSTQVTPVTKRLDSTVRRIFPVSGSIWWILRSRYCPTQSVPSAQVSPESRPPPGAGMVESTAPVSGSIFWMRSLASWKKYRPSKAVPACAATSIERSVCPLCGSKAFSLSPEANQTFSPSKLTPCIRSTPGKGPYSRRISAGECFMS
ncbi:mlr1907 [Mesorhizobium japonicum MAFF 303099]|uniref:Mlr1907 protein n=1 Tax=Mesorhizobium japonicum (strain LMG 29417 / CECT 9101 / MAFF 303099) TaxID=266835 RepID=Q98JK1_RHILO|nr:mlr1907 [Mesorhizobium japonicum MAFF 303099]